MSLMTECEWAIVRATCIGTLALVLGYPLRALLVSLPRGSRKAAWVLLLVPYLTPALLVGYGYSHFSLSLVRHPTWKEAFYSILICMKLVPIAALILYFAPSYLSPAALHCRRLLKGQGRKLDTFLGRLSFLMRGPARAGAIAFVLVFLFAFAEFEIASLFGIRNWTVSLFDAQIGGLTLSASLRLALLPLLLEGILLVIALAILLGSRQPPAHSTRRQAPLDTRQASLVWSYLILALGAVTVVPAFLVLRGAIQGMGILVQNFVLTKDIAASTLFALAAAACAYLIAGWFIAGGIAYRRTGAGLLGAALAAAPGLLGPLLLALLTLSLFQTPILRAARDTPLPLVLTLMLLLLPFALLLRLLLHAIRRGEALQAASLLENSPSASTRRHARELIWELKTRARFWVAFLLFCWAYFDLLASALLAPSGMTPVLVRLYNFMHYGESAVLSAMVSVAFCVPLILLLLGSGARGIFARLSTHE